MFDGKQLEAYLTVCREGSFERAAALLGLTQSAVSQRVRALEASLGHTLLTRGRPCMPTPAGQRLSRYLERIRLLEDEALRDLGGDPVGPSRLALACNADSLHAWLPQVLADAFDKSPYLAELHVEDQDYTHELLARGEVLACISTRAKAMQGCTAEALGVMRYLCVATPLFARRHFTNGLSRAALEQAPALVYNRKDDLHAEYLARHFGIGDDHYPYHIIPSSQGFVDMARLHFGYALVPELAIAKELKSGALIDLNPSHPASVPLYLHAWQIQAPGVENIFRRIIGGARLALRQR